MTNKVKIIKNRFFYLRALFGIIVLFIAMILAMILTVSTKLFPILFGIYFFIVCYLAYVMEKNLEDVEKIDRVLYNDEDQSKHLK